jgi:tryptophan 2,3-dioxygenase
MTEDAKSSPSPPAYWDYLHLDRLLDSQGGIEDDEESLLPDELHFILVHQVFELWFKLVLRELRLARDHLAAPRVPEERIPYVVRHVGRINEVLRLAVDQFQLVETLTPQDFLAFRDKLVPASGFQSFQMREIEVLLGLDGEQRVSVTGSDPLQAIRQAAGSGPGGAIAWQRIEAARAETSLRSALHDWLYRTPIQGSVPDDDGDAAAVEAFVRDYLDASEAHHRGQLERMVAVGLDGASVEERLAAEVRLAGEFLRAEDRPERDRERTRRVRAGILFIESYRRLPLMAWPRSLLDAVVGLEELLILWRTRHARMVERVIGRRVGTGGSSGVDYLESTTRYRVFPELWTVRTLLLPREVLPELKRPEFYGFAV